jgi:hypothetical protein
MPIWLMVKIEPFFLFGITLIYYTVCKQPKEKSATVAKD